MTTKTHILNQFKEAAARLRKDLPEERRPELQQVERAFGELRQMHAALSRRLEDAEAEASSEKRAACQAAADAQQAETRAEALGQRLASKEQEVGRLQKGLADAESLLVDQKAKGFNVVMVKDFLDQLELDLRTVIDEDDKILRAGAPGLREPAPALLRAVRPVRQLRPSDGLDFAVRPHPGRLGDRPATGRRPAPPRTR